ncbi:methylated-DNA--[protein]-cysteine S-methyltransferase [Stieleria sp. ICT_E10.1]|uniref:methylated-DNA--[protein]-cysteine S-methyltransferase n=1 Tax=Stieleria sedimenti TaxID=2976331 RepID=UPI0021808786|nr:methylated-DNA--[protein]-cysteine S-methyltransferase [Stieleria sedimenti]MCS7467589.1 methylated-DNA--[protein]-cysteine S-methyltransferase [Stieleria sedimenti]
MNLTTAQLTAQTGVERDHWTALGTMVSTWTAAGLYSLRWQERPGLHQGPGADDGPGDVDARVEDLDQRLREYFTTGHADFDAIEVDTQGWTPFTKQVYRCCRAIAPGTTITYQELARRAGNKAASRAVGAAMARNRILLVIPCHRVVSTGGGLRGFSAPGGLQTKQFLLDLETE